VASRGWGLPAAIVGGLVLVGAVAAVIDRPDRDDAPPASTAPPTSAPDPAAVAAFLAAWERSRTAPFVLEADYRQERGGVVVQEGPQRTVQRPPDRLVEQFGSIDGRLGSRRVGCAPGPTGALACRWGSDAPPFDDEVATELRRLRGYVEGDRPLYRVTADADGACFDLALALRFPVPPYGERARFCFDAATGAPVHQEVVRGDVVDRTVARSVRVPTAADLALPAEATG